MSRYVRKTLTVIIQPNDARCVRSALLQNKYLHSSAPRRVDWEQNFFLYARANNKSGRSAGGFTTRKGFVTDKVTLFRVTVLRHGGPSNRENNTLSCAEEKERGLSLIRKTRQSTRKFLPYVEAKEKCTGYTQDLIPVSLRPGIPGIPSARAGDSANAHARSSVSRTRGNQ